MRARFIYSFILWLALPLVLIRLAWRGFRQPGYWQHVPERFGWCQHEVENPVIWLHAVSVGETRAATRLLTLFRQQYPHHQLLLTHGTPTGRAMGTQLYGATVWQAYLPYDLGFAVRRFVRHYRPQLGLLMETEIWPNLLRVCCQENVPVMLINARLSERSAQRYRYLGSVLKTALASLCAVAAQSEADAQRLRELGAVDPQVIGNLKFDTSPPEAQRTQAQHWRSEWKNERLTCLAASTREGEESLLLDAWQHTHKGEALLIIVPRHPQRFDAVAQLLRQRGVRFQRRSDGLAVDKQTQVWLGDSMGEMFAYYGVADVTLMGGSFLPFGGQSMIEAAAMGSPVLIGPHRWNFSEVSRTAIASGAAIAVPDAAHLPKILSELLADVPRRAHMGLAALQYSHRHQGATERLMPIIGECLRQDETSLRE
uniref:Kdo transferase n=1 Tax=mine drainage metagenome TaxID=410659 RepID=E6QSG9_9ZZZZ